MIPRWEQSADQAVREDGIVVLRHARYKWRATHPVHGLQRSSHGKARTWSTCIAAMHAMDEQYPPDRIETARGMPIVCLTGTQANAVRQLLTHDPGDPAVLGSQVWLGGANRGVVARLAQQLEATNGVAACRAARRLREAIPAMPTRHDRSREPLQAPQPAQPVPTATEAPDAPARPQRRVRGRKRQGSLRDQIRDWITAQEQAGHSPTAGEAAAAFDLPVVRYFRIMAGGPLDHHPA